MGVKSEWCGISKVGSRFSKSQNLNANIRHHLEHDDDLLKGKTSVVDRILLIV